MQHVCGDRKAGMDRLNLREVEMADDGLIESELLDVERLLLHWSSPS